MKPSWFPSPNLASPAFYFAANMISGTRSRTPSLGNRSPSSLSVLPPLRTRLRKDSLSASCPPSSFTSPIATSVQLTPSTLHANRTIYRSLPLEIHLFSPSLKSTYYDNPQLSRLLPVYHERDQIQGRVMLDRTCSHTGRLSISLEGAFCYPSETSGPSGVRKHIFQSSTTSFTVCPTTDNMSRSTFKDAFNSTLRKRPSHSQIDSDVQAQRASDRSFFFHFDLPSGMRPGEELPPSFSTRPNQNAPFLADTFEVTYKIIVSWSPSDKGERQCSLEAPFIFEPDTEFQSYDGLDKEPESWLEMPLKCDRKIPFRCAVTLPSPVTFSRSTTVPYFVVFTTTPRHVSLAQEIAADASISIFLIRQIVVNESPSLPPTPPTTPSSAEDHSSNPAPGGPMQRLRRIASNNSMNRSPRNVDEMMVNKSLPRLPTQVAFNESRTIQSSLCIGFPKRPRHRCEPQSHPSLESHAALPDGLHKSKIYLDKGMLPCIDWGGISVKYYLDVSVLFGQDDTRARIPLRIW